ncbi:hypothetical protein L1987_28837 [Smallanthus sonchifolius]|uniref:Uncharacterized protein n=1 Tax=Smallanthus sonchifolius TaxID=185202 RepID=A0ACB9HZ59_9ASTR|nr:hypothetical protein L1987_28837 [Smallanthus sonchifolius]
MAISSTFKERLEQMEDTRNQRLSLLQAEKELQLNKSQTLASKLSGIGYIEQRCLKLEHKVASQQFIISSIKSQLDHLDSVYLDQIQQFRVLKSEVENLEELDKEKDKYFALKAREIDEFRIRSEIFATECQRRVEEMRNCVNELNSSFIHLQHSAGYSDNSDLAAAELRKSELQAMKENVDRRLASNYETRAQLQKQLKSMLISQKEWRKPSNVV